MSYWDGWFFNKAEYTKDLIWAYKLGTKIIDAYKIKQFDKPKCVIFDIDDTIVFGDPEEEVGCSDMNLGTLGDQDLFVGPINDPIGNLVKYCKKNGFIIIILTARPPTSKLASEINMKMFNIPYDKIECKPRENYEQFKIDRRKEISKNYTICLTVGDQVTDVIFSGINTSFIKLPEPESKASYAYISPTIKLISS